MLRGVINRVFGSSQPPPATPTIKDEPASSSVHGGDGDRDVDEEGGMEGLEFQDADADADASVNGEVEAEAEVSGDEEGDPNSQLSPLFSRDAALEDSDPEEDFEDPSSQLIQPLPPASPKPKKKSKKKTKKTATFPEAEGEQPVAEDEDEESGENRRGSRLSAGISTGPIMSDNMDVDPDMDGQVDGALNSTQKREKNGRFGKKARAAAKKAQREADEQVDGALNSTQKREKNGRFGKKARAAAKKAQREADALNSMGSSESVGKAKNSRVSKAAAEMDAESQLDLESQATDYSIPTDNAPVPLKSTQRKRKAETPIVKPIRATVNGGDISNGDASQEENSQEYLLQASNQLRNDALSSAPRADENEDGTPSRPSNKALGKRKAVEPITNTTKKSKRRKTTESASRDLTEMGFSFLSGSESISKDQGSPSDPHASLSAAELEKKARTLYSQTVREESARRVSTTPILPQGYDRSVPARRFPTPKRYSTPQFTPINRGPANVPGQRIDKELQKTVERERDQSELLQDEETVENERSAPQSRSTVSKSTKRRKKKDDAPAGEPEDNGPAPRARSSRRPSVVEDEYNDDKALSARESQSPAPAPATAPSGKRKRRITSYEAESSTGNSKKTSRTPGRPSLKPKTPKDPKTPKPSNTPKASGTPGQLSKDDIEAISDAIKNYRDMHDMTDYEINAMVQGNAAAEGKDLWKDVYDFAPHISKTKIVNSARRKFHNFDGRGVWTKEQDDELRDAHNMYPGKWTKISQLINKFPEDCRDRWRNYLICGDKQRKDLWDQDEEAKLKNAVKESLETIRDLQKRDKTTRDKPEETLINWAHISEAMNHTRSRLQCAAKWKQLKERQDSSDTEDVPLDAPVDANPWRAYQAEEASRTMGAPKKLEVLRAIRNSEAGKERKVPWSKVKEEANFSGKSLALKALFKNLKKQIPENREMRFRNILDFLIEKFEHSMPDEPEDFAAMDPLPEKKRRNSKQKRKSTVSSARVCEDDSDNGEGPSDSPRRRMKRTSKSASEEVQIENPEDDSSGNAESPNTTSEPQRSSKLSLKSKAKSRLLSQERSAEKPKSRLAVVIQSHRKDTSKPANEEEVVDGPSQEPAATPMPSARKSKSRSKSDNFSRNERGRSKPTSNEDPAENEDDSEVHDLHPRNHRGKFKFKIDESPAQDADDSEVQHGLVRDKNGKFKSKSNRPQPKEREGFEVPDSYSRNHRGRFKSKIDESPAQDRDDSEVQHVLVKDKNGKFRSKSNGRLSEDKESFEVQDTPIRSKDGKFKSKNNNSSGNDKGEVNSKSNKSPSEDRDNFEVQASLSRSKDGKFKSKSKDIRNPISNEATVDAAEEFQNGGSSVTTKKRRQSKSKKTSPPEEEDVDEEQLDGPEVSTTLKRPNSKSTSAESREEQDINEARSTSKTTKKKLRERMKLLGESQSQESANGNQTSTQDTNNDIEMILSSLKNGKGKSREDLGHESDRITESDEEPMAAASDHESDENADQMDVDNDEEESILDEEETLNAHASDVNADEMDLDEDHAAAEGTRIDSDMSEQQQEEIRDHSPSVDLNAPTSDDSDDEESSNGDTREPTSFVNGMDHNSEEVDVDRDLANELTEEELEDFERRHPTSDSDEDEAELEPELANGVDHEESDEDPEKQSLRSDSNKADAEPHAAGDTDQDDEDDEDQDDEDQSPTSDSDDSDKAEVEKPLTNGHESHDDLEPLTTGEDVENPTRSNEAQPAQDLDDETSTSGPDTDSDSEPESESEDEDEDETQEQHSPVVTNGSHRGSPSPDNQHKNDNLDSSRKDAHSPPRGPSPSPDLDTPKANDGRRRTDRSPATFGRYTGRRNRFARSPSVSSGSDSSIPARVDRRRDISPEGSVEL